MHIDKKKCNIVCNIICLQKISYFKQNISHLNGIVFLCNENRIVFNRIDSLMVGVQQLVRSSLGNLNTIKLVFAGSTSRRYNDQIWTIMIYKTYTKTCIIRIQNIQELCFKINIIKHFFSFDMSNSNMRVYQTKLFVPIVFGLDL